MQRSGELTLRRMLACAALVELPLASPATKPSVSLCRAFPAAPSQPSTRNQHIDPRRAITLASVSHSGQTTHLWRGG
jgi:hypothetical protein